MAGTPKLRIESLENRFSLSVSAMALAVSSLQPVAAASVRTVAPTPARSVQFTSEELVSQIHADHAAATAKQTHVSLVSHTGRPRRYRALSQTVNRTHAQTNFNVAARPGAPVSQSVQPVQTSTPPAVLTSTAAPASQTTPDTRYQQQGPVKALTWNKSLAGADNLTGMIWVTRLTSPQAAAAESLTKPPGMAGLFLWDLANDIFTNPQDAIRTPAGKLTAFRGPFADNGIAVVKARVSAFLTAFKAAGGRIDYLVLDDESVFGSYALKRDQLNAIAADPRGKALLKSLNITNLNDLLDWRANPAEHEKWDKAVAQFFANALNQAVFDVAKPLFPNARTSNFNGSLMTAPPRGYDGFATLATSLSRPGNTNSPELYGHFGTLDQFELVKGQKYGKSPFAVLRWEVNRVRATLRSSADPVVPWISFHDGDSYFAKGDQYQEMLYHSALSGASNFLFWNPDKWLPTQKPGEYATDSQTRLVDQVLADVNLHLGAGSRTVVTTDTIAWDSACIVSGVQRADGAFVYRVSVPAGTKQVENRATHQVYNLNGALGIWIETPSSTPLDMVIR